MNWFKFAKDFSDRNTINGKIRYLRDVKSTLERISKLVFQSGKIAKNTNYKIISSSKITSYPLLHQILIDADYSALDNPWQFEALCSEAVAKIDGLVFAFQKEREALTYGKTSKTPPK